MKKTCMIICIATLFFTACDDLTSIPDNLTLQEIARELDREVGEAPARLPNQCSIIAFGSKPCGGPWSFLIYSNEFSDVDKVEALTKRFNELHREFNIENGLASTCEATQVPEVVLKNRKCQGVNGQVTDLKQVIQIFEQF